MYGTCFAVTRQYFAGNKVHLFEIIHNTRSPFLGPRKNASTLKGYLCNKV